MDKITKNLGATAQESGHSFGHTLDEKRCDQNFADRLKSRREFLGLTQETLAHKADVTKATIQNYEYGKPPKGDAVVKISKALRCTTDWLLIGEGDPNGPVTKEIGNEIDCVTKQKQAEPVEKQARIHNAEDFKITDMVTKTMEILESETIFRTALASNINAFHQALKFEAGQKARDDRMAEMERRMDSQDRRQGELEAANTELRKENGKLKEELGDLQQRLADRGSGLLDAANHR
ncbi:MAG: helix-turn-helix transcriptional regulator [Desulfobacterales bacterium]|jgi:transcriptional regulator with XRE-family HTH domain|nr:helix-turn-helix transcriptional regulator [Desulfobacterales bacterium]